MHWELQINKDAFVVATHEELCSYLIQADQPEFLDLWLRQSNEDNSDGAAICILANRDHAWLMYLRHDGDVGFSSRNPLYNGPPDAPTHFLLSNGQLDEYPQSWTISRESAFRALEHFFLSCEKAPWIIWHEN